MHPEYLFASKFIHIGNHRIHYIDEGSGPVIVMVHGNPTWSFYFRNLINLLSSRFRVIAIDHIGCGLSDKPQDYTYCLDNHISNLQNVLVQLKIKKYSLVVHDWGGAIGMGVATRGLTNIEKIVVLNTAAFRSQRIPLRIQLCKLPLLGEFLVRAFNAFAWPATFMAVENSLNKETKEAYLKPYNSWGNRIAVYNFVKDIPLKVSHPSYNSLLKIEKGLEQLKANKIPMLILWGGKDFCFNNYFYEEWLQRFPDAEAHYFHDKGHYILEDNFKDLEPLFLNFFTQ